MPICEDRQDPMRTQDERRALSYGPVDPKDCPPAKIVRAVMVTLVSTLERPLPDSAVVPFSIR